LYRQDVVQRIVVSRLTALTAEFLGGVSQHGKCDHLIPRFRRTLENFGAEFSENAGRQLAGGVTD